MENKIDFENESEINKIESENNDAQLVAYVEKLLEAGLSKKQINEQLLAVGWSENQIDAAYSQALIKKGVPIPSKAMQSTFGKKSSTVEIALNLFSFILLGTVATALGALFFGIINKYFPDALKVSYYYRSRSSSSAIHYSIAALLVGFPLYYLVMRLWLRSFIIDKAKMETRLTKWLTYLVLLIASVTIVGDLIAVVYTFLQGEITTRFFLKALTIIMIAGIIFAFYYLERKRVQYRQSISSIVFKSFGMGVSLIVIIGIILGFLASGSPSTERKRGFDKQRERDLSSLSSCVERYAKKYEKLPVTLSELEKTSYAYCANKKDPETKTPYEYRVISASKVVGTKVEGEFQLCGNFSLMSENNNKGGLDYYETGSIWKTHVPGRNCHTQKVILRTMPTVKPPIAPSPSPVFPSDAPSNSNPSSNSDPFSPSSSSPSSSSAPSPTPSSDASSATVPTSASDNSSSSSSDNL